MCARRAPSAGRTVQRRADLRYPSIVTALFANHRETNLISTVALVEQVLDELGYIDLPELPDELPPRVPGTTAVSEPGASHVWRLARGSATTRVAVVDPTPTPHPAAHDRASFPHLRVSAVVMTLDAAVDRAALFGRLLALNAELCGVAFALDGDRVLLISERSTLDLDHSEARDAIERVTTLADEHDDALVARFGGRIGGG
jgi:hypothetical protein